MLVKAYVILNFCFSQVLLWIVLIAVLVMIRINFTNCFVCQGLFINNSVTPDKLGAINGLAVTVTSVFRYDYVVYNSYTSAYTYLHIKKVGLIQC